MRPRRVGVALGAPILLLAAACGSQRAGVFHPTGALAAASPQSSAASPAALVPFPGQVSFEFDALPANVTDAAVVTRDRDFILAYYYAIYARGKNKSYLSYIANNGVLTSVQTNIAEQVDAGHGFTGTDRHFDTTVTQAAGTPGDLTVNYCVDEAGLHVTDIKTGRVLPAGSTAGTATSAVYYYESDTLARGHGTWDVVGTDVTPYPSGPARECHP